MTATNSETCYGWDAHAKVVLRFQSEYQRHLWIANGHPEFPEDRQEVRLDVVGVAELRPRAASAASGEPAADASPAASCEGESVRVLIADE